MNRREFAQRLLTAGLGAFFGRIAAASASRAQKPNIVMIFADDLGTGDLACYGHPYAVTPNIDRLATEGTRFTRYYATGVTCCPSRTGFMTSRHPASFENYMSAYGFGDRITITELLRNNDYVTGHFGKWHIGPEKPGQADAVYGIDEVGIIGDSERLDAGRDDDLFDAAIDFIKRNRDGKPFYVNIWGHITHYPVKPNKRFDHLFGDLEVDESRFDAWMADKFENTRKRGFDVNTCMRSYLEDVYSLDLAIGRVLNALDKWDLTDNTIVVFTSDQGPAPNGEIQNERQAAKPPVYKANMLGWAGGLRGGKHEQYEGGVRIPFILRWPEHVPAGRVNSTSVLSGLDWLPTLCALTSTQYDASQFEGLDVSDVWHGADRNPDRYLFWKAARYPTALCGSWKIHLGQNTTELYNLDSDPGETTNVAGQYPEICKRMTGEIQEWVGTLPTEVNRKRQKSEQD